MNDSSDDNSIETDKVPEEGVLLGLDHGLKRIGIAVSTKEQTIAGALENYNRRSESLDRKFLAQLVKESRAVGIVVGLPVHMSGDEGEQAKICRLFGAWVKEVAQLPVIYWDERYTSAIADLYLMQADTPRKKRKALRDKIAAQIMLQSFLDSSDRDQPPVSFRK